MAKPGNIPKKRGAPRGPRAHKSLPPNGRRPYTMMLDAVTHRVLKLHALRRSVYLTDLISDVLNQWLAHVTDYDQAIFRETLPPRTRAPRPPERYAGYLDTLGFSEAPRQAPANPTPLPPSAVAGVHPQGGAYPGYAPNPQPTLLDLATPHRHPLADGPAAYPHPEPTLPHGSQLFDEDRHNAIAPVRGHGSAALEATNGTPPERDQHPLPREVEAYREFYRVNPEDVR